MKNLPIGTVRPERHTDVWSILRTGKGKDKGERRRDGKGKDGEKGFANVPWLRPAHGVQSLDFFPVSAKNAVLLHSPQQ